MNFMENTTFLETEDVHYAEYLIVTGRVDINITGYYGESKLHDAVGKRDIEMVKMLIKHGIDQSIEGICGPAVCAETSREIWGILLSSDSIKYINYPPNDNKTILHYIILNGNFDDAAYLISKGATLTPFNDKK